MITRRWPLRAESTLRNGSCPASTPCSRTQEHAGGGVSEDGRADKAEQRSRTAETVSEAIVERLIAWGVRRIYGFPGDGINGVLGALRRAQDRIDFIQLAHEELAGMAACAHAKFTGELGVCLSTGGPGLIHMLNEMYDAKLDHTPARQRAKLRGPTRA